MNFDFWTILFAVDWLLYIPVGVAVIYMTVFAAASLFNRRPPVPKAKRRNRFLVIVVAHQDDDTIMQTVNTVLGQRYADCDIIVVSNKQKEITNFKLAQIDLITLLTTDFNEDWKLKGIQLAIHNCPQLKIYDIAVILDGKSSVLPEFLDEINAAFLYAGTKCIQAHCISQNRDNSLPVIDSTFEEISNVIYRQGHVSLGLPAALSGTGMAFDFTWLKENIFDVDSTWEDKGLESLLLRQGVYTDYFKDIYVFTKKDTDIGNFVNKHVTWIMAQFYTALGNLKYIPKAIYNKQYDFLNKELQWLLPPRTVMMGIIIMMSLFMPFIYFTLAIKWWITGAYVLFLFSMIIPDYLVDDKWDTSFIKASFLFFKKNKK